jgi:protein required for attachment to host cells
MKLKFPQDAGILVGDGHKAILLWNEGDELRPNLQVENLFEVPLHPPTHLQGTDRPGRTATRGQRGAIETTNGPGPAEHRFSEEIALAIETTCSIGDIKALIVVAPPRTLAELRAAFGEEPAGSS